MDLGIIDSLVQLALIYSIACIDAIFYILNLYGIAIRILQFDIFIVAAGIGHGVATRRARIVFLDFCKEIGL